VLKLKSGLVKLEYFPVDVDMVLSGPVNSFVLWAKALLKDDSKRFAFFSDALKRREIKLHAIVVMSTKLVGCEQALSLPTLILLALKCVIEGLQKNSSSLPSFEVGRFVLSKRSYPVAWLVSAVKDRFQAELSATGVHLDKRTCVFSSLKL